MDRTELVLGRGEVFLDRFLPGTRTGEGERYIGNTTGFQIERRFDTVDVRKASRGVKSKSFKDIVGEDVTLSFVTDNISMQNLGDWMGGDAERVTFAGDGAQMETVELVPGRFYQLGKHLFPGIGARNLFGLSVRVGENFVSDLYIDAQNGRFGVPLSRTDLIGQTATVEYEIRFSRSDLIETTRKAVRAAIRFLGKNAVGRNCNYYFPHVMLTPRDQVQLKGDTWQTLTFEADVLAPMVIYNAGKAGRSPGEQALIDEGLAANEFIVLEGVLHRAVNNLE